MIREELVKIYKENGLNKSDVFMMKMGGKEIPIITRSGIEKIQANQKIAVKFDVISYDINNVVIKAIGSKGDLVVETFGESSPKNTKQAYPFAMAEKRGLSRVILKITGMYQEGFLGEDEISEVEEQEWSATQGQIDYANQLLEESQLEETEYHFIQTAILEGGDLSDIIETLKGRKKKGETQEREYQFKRFSK